MNFKLLPIDDLSPLEHNPRQISNENFTRLKNSLQNDPDFIKLRPILAYPSGDKLFIYAGNQRWRACKELGWTEIPVIIDSETNLKTIRSRTLLDNVEYGSWDKDILIESWDLEEIRNLDLPELDELLKKIEILPDPHDDEADLLSPTKEITALGDLYEIHSDQLVHKVYCADSTKLENVETLMSGQKAQMVFTDPPYNVKVDTIGGNGKVKHEDFVMASGEMSEEEFIQFLKDVFVNYVMVTVPGSIHYVCMDWKHIYEIVVASRGVYSGFKNLCIWNKDNGGMGTFYRNKHELIFVFKNGDQKHINNFELGQYGRYRTNVWDYPSANSFASDGKKEKDVDGKNSFSGDVAMHPTVKPINLVADAILDCSENKGLILDLFLGSGTTLIASDQTGRNCFGQELDPKYVDVIIRRYISYANKQNKIYSIYKNSQLLGEDEINQFIK